MKLLKYIPILALILWACEPEIDGIPTPSSGSQLNLSNYMAIGNSLTAGYSSGGLSHESQMNSFPAILNKQFAQAGGNQDFKQPVIEGNGSGYLYLESLDPSTGSATIGRSLPDASFAKQVTGPFNNFGVPGLRAIDVTVKGYGFSQDKANPYFWRMLGGTDATTKSYLELVGESKPTFFTCWIGNNDVLGYASTGGAYGESGEPGTFLNGLSPVELFSQSYAAMMQALTVEKAKGIVLTIPDVTLIPYFTLIPWNALVLNNEQANLANGQYSAMIDPAIDSAVQVAVIGLAVTEKAVSGNVVPSLAQGTVYQGAYTKALSQGANQAKADSIAKAYVASSDGQTEIKGLTDGLNADLRNHLTGGPLSNSALQPLFDEIDKQLATNTTLQAGIAEGIKQTTLAYEAGALPKEQQDAIAEAIATNSALQIQGLKAAGIYPTFQAGPNGFVIEVPVSNTNPLGIRQMVAGELVLLTANSEGQLTPQNAALPKPDQYILTKEEIALINKYTKDYNDIINGYASSDVAVINSNDLLKQYIDGVFINGVKISGQYIQGGLFSLDGIHLTQRGYAAVANEIIKTINTKFDSQIPITNISEYPGVKLP